MTRGQRSAHLLIWLALAVTLAVTLGGALLLRPAEPVNDALPTVLGP